MSLPNHEWKIRVVGQKPIFSDLYGSDFNTYFTSLEIFHGGNFTPTSNRDYIGSKITYVDFVEVHKLSYELLSDIIKVLNYKGETSFYQIEKSFGLDLGLMKLKYKYDFQQFYSVIFPKRCNQVHRIYVEMSRKSQIACFPTSLKKANARVIENLLFDFVVDHPNATNNDVREFVFQKYAIWISPTYLMPGLVRVRQNLRAINGDL